MLPMMVKCQACEFKYAEALGIEFGEKQANIICPFEI